MSNRPAGITIVGLGPGDGSLLTRQAWQIIMQTSPIYLRTARHPAVADLPEAVEQASFDHLYESETDFAHVYSSIVAEVLRLGRRPEGVVYAVPGDPSMGESTVSRIRQLARDEGIPLTMVPGVSFVEPVLQAVGWDGMTGLQLFDAIEVAAYLYPPINPDLPAMLGQVYSRLLAGDLKLSLMSLYSPEYEVMLIHGAGVAGEIVEKVPLYAIDRSEHINHLTTLFIPPKPVPTALSALADAVAVLRSPEGCPWDQEQTSSSLRSGFLEEASEVLEAIDSGDAVALQEELGDVLLHIVMQAQIASEDEVFQLSDVIAGIYAKIRRRHPHIWGDMHVSSTQDVLANWEAIKAKEKPESGRASLLDNVPVSLPALARSQIIQNRVKKVGFDWPTVEGVEAKLHEEIAELLAAGDSVEQHREMGDIFFALVNWARWLGVDAESALREANLRFAGRFRVIEGLAAERGLDLAALDIDELEGFWREAKLILSASEHERK